MSLGKANSETHLTPLDEEEDSFQEEMGYSSSFSRDSGRKRKRLFAIVGTVLLVVALIVLIVAFASSSSSSKQQDGGKKDKSLWQGVRLPRSILPDTYKLEVEPNFNQFTFRVNEEISLILKEKTDTIVMHQVGLEISDVTLVAQGKSGKELKVSEILFNDTLQYVYFVFNDLPKWFEESIDKVTLKMKVNGKLNTNMNGFYRSSYYEDGKLQWLATTDFEPIDARKAFVCFDEPNMKAFFTVSMIVPEEYKALSNMPEVSTSTVENGRKKVDFKKSFKMSTYLVCYIACKYEYLEDNVTLPNTRVRVYSTPQTVSQGEWALQVAVKALKGYEDFFGIPFPLPKMDLIAIPDYSAGAMENWGLITFRETALMYDPNLSSVADKQRVATVVAHELAHQWFGNLVTMDWWSELWLNEGFASFMEYVGVTFARKDWDMWSQFLFLDRSRALELDSLKSTHPVSVPINNPSEIAQQFDTISYSKGASIIRMLYSYLSLSNPDYFTLALQNYLKDHQYGNAKSADLWEAFAKVSKDQDVIKMMEGWSQQAGYPLISISKTSSTSFVVSQERYFKIPTESDELWRVPLQLRNEKGNVKNFVLKDKQTTVSFEQDTSYILCGLFNGSGYYRVKYSDELFEDIVETLRENLNSIDTSFRLSLLDDIFSLVSSGTATPKQAFNLVQYFKDEDDYSVWRVILSKLSLFDVNLQFESSYGLFQEFMQNLVSSKAQSIGWNSTENESHTLKMLRPLLLRRAAMSGDKQVIDTALQIFHDFMEEKVDIPTDLRSAIYYTAIENGNFREFEWLLQRYMTTNVAAEKVKCMYALCKSKEPYLLQRTLELSLNTSVIRSQDTENILGSIAANIYGRDLAWDFFRENVDLIYERYAGEAFTLDDIITEVTQYFNTEFKFKEVEQFFKEAHPVSQGSRSVDRALEKIRSNIKWLEMNKKQVEEWLIQWKKENQN